MRIQTTFVPCSEVKQQTPPTPDDDANLSGVVLDMKQLAQMPKADLMASLRKLKDAYASWIDGESGKLNDSAERLFDHQTAAQRAISRCKRACTRIAEGIDLIETDSTAEEAFRFANHAMWLHMPPRADEWLHVETVSPRAAAGRGLSLARFHDLQGRYVASATQECLMAYAG